MIQFNEIELEVNMEKKVMPNLLWLKIANRRASLFAWILGGEEATCHHGAIERVTLSHNSGEGVALNPELPTLELGNQKSRRQLNIL